MTIQFDWTPAPDVPAKVHFGVEAVDRAGNKNAAVCMKMHFFKIATVKPLPSGSGLSPLVQAAVYLGADFAAKHPVS